MLLIFIKQKLILIHLLLIYELSSSQRCGLSEYSVRIIGGKTTNRLSWPWMTLLHIEFRKSDGRSVTYKCGASLISDNWVLTAAHCFRGSIGEEYIGTRIILGEYDTSRREGTELELKASRIVRHNYNPRTNENDIALIQLNQRLNLRNNPYLTPICLPNNLTVNANNCYATGWGKVSNGGSDAIVLQQLRLPLIEKSYCRSVWKNIFKSQSMFCAGYKEGGRDTCQGDSGGPIVCPLISGTWVQIGVTSFGQQCAQRGRPGIYTKVSNYVNWIKSVTGI